MVAKSDSVSTIFKTKLASTMGLSVDSEKGDGVKEDLLIFDGSPSEDVNHAKSFWKSLTLQPPLESRLVSADIRQRLRIEAPLARTKPERVTNARDEAKTAVFLHRAHENILKDEKNKYQKVMAQREAVLNLVHKQRMERLQKEIISLPFKPKQTDHVKTAVGKDILDEMQLHQKYDRSPLCCSH